MTTRPGCRRRAAMLAACALLAAGRGEAQTQVALHAAFAADRRGEDPPALAWLRHQVLPARPEWPKDRSATAPFTVHWQEGRLVIGEALALPPALAVAGELTIDGTSIPFACNIDGREAWTIEDAAVPPDLAALLASLNLHADAGPRTIDVPALLGNLAGAAVEGDATAQLLSLGAVLCGELTLAAQREAAGLRVRGRSGGGLIVPAALLWCALHRDGSTPPVDRDAAWRLRAFGSRDGDRAEATRQLQRGGKEAVPALRALLHADEHSRLSAIDGLLRLRAAGELPFIVAAATETMPLAAAMARTAVRELWPLASTATRERTLAALRTSPVLDASVVIDATRVAPAADARLRWFGVLLVVFTGLLGLWMRERARID